VSVLHPLKILGVRIHRHRDFSIERRALLLQEFLVHYSDHFVPLLKSSLRKNRIEHLHFSPLNFKFEIVVIAEIRFIPCIKLFLGWAQSAHGVSGTGLPVLDVLHALNVFGQFDLLPGFQCRPQKLLVFSLDEPVPVSQRVAGAS
jgi:hypothetical protein